MSVVLRASSSGLRLVNADVLSRELDIDAYAAAGVADRLRQELVRRRESFAFETVFSDPFGDKVNFLKNTAAAGYTVAVCFIGLASAELSEERVAMRVSQGGPDMPTDKLTARFPRILANLKLAIAKLPHVIVFDNSDLAHPYQQLALFNHGQTKELVKPVPIWLRDTV